MTDDFIENIRKTLDDYKKRVLIGEVWEDASNKVAYSKRRRYVYGNGLYGVMNYPLRKCIIDLVLSSRSPLEIAHELMQLRENYPRDFFFNSLNNLDTHDTKRIITACSGKMQLVRTAWELLFMFPGFLASTTGMKLVLSVIPIRTTAVSSHGGTRIKRCCNS